MKTHELKTLPEYFEQVWSGNKRFELRKNDRDFQENDILILKEFNSENNTYTQREIWCTISYILKDFTGIEKDYCILSIKNVQTYFNR